MVICLSWVPFAIPNLDILGVKFDIKLIFEDHVRGIASRVCQRIGIFKLVKRVFVDTSVLLPCYYTFVLPILEYCSQVWGSAADRCIWWTGIVVIGVSCNCVIDVMLLDCVCCLRLMRT